MSGRSAGETRPEMIRRLLDALNRQEVEIAAAAERYKDKQMDEPTLPPGSVAIKHLIGDVVRLKLDEEGTPGYVTGIMIRQAGVTYWITWGDTRGETPHNDFELTTEPPIAA